VPSAASGSSDGDGVAPKSGGLYDGFDAYRTATDSDYDRLLTDGLVVPDTNVLLNLYRYNEQTRSDLLSILHRVGHLWVPHQVVAEFWRNRESVLRDPRDTATNVRRLAGYRDQATGTLRGWANRVGLPQDRTAALQLTLTRAFDDVTQAVSELADEQTADFARDTAKDPVLHQLEGILRGRVGAPLGEAEYEKAVKEAESRTAAKRPPGYKDTGKTEGSPAGDYLVWCQLLQEARRAKRDVLLITGDVKEDWWRREQGEIRGPRPELAQELRDFAGVRLFMLRPESLLVRARRALKIQVHEESVQDAERVDRSLAEAALRQETDGANVAAEEIRSAWPDIRNAVKKRSRVAWMMLSTATVERLVEDILTVKFPRDGEASGFIDNGHDAHLAEAIYQVLGMQVRVSAVGPKIRRTGSFAWPSKPESTDARETSESEDD
jgi:PIN like domain